ncbi:MAG: GNAT family N-acetyltransferase, partial [Proteobacteria bacterium]|nr:GNAT family N-acetyltransferase [Pseudomonadota bacterium]
MKTSVELLCDHPGFVSQVADWLREEWPGFFSVRNPKSYVEARLQRHKLPLTLIALRGKEPVGTVALSPKSLRAYTHLSPWVSGLVVRRGYRRHGIGSQLVAAATELGWRLGNRRLYVAACHPKLVARLGWRFIARAQHGGQRIAVMGLSH